MVLNEILHLLAPRNANDGVVAKHGHIAQAMGVALPLLAIDDKRANVRAVDFVVNRTAIEIDRGVGRVGFLELDRGFQPMNGIEVHRHSKNAVAGHHHLGGHLFHEKLLQFLNVLLWRDRDRHTYVTIIVP